MKLRDNLTIFAVAASAVSLEAYIIGLWWFGRDGGSLRLDLNRYLLVSQAYLVGVGILVYASGRRVIRPLESILEGIAHFRRGRLQHRIPPSRVQELDDLANQLNRMAARLAELDRLKNDFVANVSHELRSPLAAMEGYVKLLLEGSPGDERARSNLMRIDANLGRLRRMVEELLDASQIEAREVRVRAEACDLAELLRELRLLFEPLAQASGVALRLETAGELPRATTDPEKVRRILTNLIDNAIKYNRAGGEAFITAGADDGSFSISVRDTGIGIPPESLDGVFERFRRAPVPSSHAPRTKGVGLGLSISRGFARALGGDLRVQSVLGTGSEFTLTLPRRSAA